ncbi:MAG: hypothetical protein ABI761_01555, partial [Saprospiraceae bacterium]
MKKTIFSISFLLCFLAFNFVQAEILQPVNANKVSVSVVTGDKFYDSGGKFGDYLNCSSATDNALNCTSSITLCAQGTVCIKFNDFVIAAGGDLLVIKSGNKIIGSSANGGLTGLTFTSDDPSGCLTVEFHATSILAAAGWDADIIVKPGKGRLPDGTCNLVCIGSVNASMPAGSCTRILTYQDFLSNPDCVDYGVTLSYPFGTNANQLPGQVDITQIGYTFIYHVYELVSGNSCWGYVTVEDKAGPQLLCKSRKASCAQLEGLTTGLGAIQDNCFLGSQKLQNVSFIPLGDGCSDPRGIALVYRDIIGFDAWGNTSTCRDTITIIRNQLSDIVCPDLVPLQCKVVCGVYTIYWDQTIAPSVPFVVSTATNTQRLYPSPGNLLAAQKAGCIPADTMVVPGIRDSVFTVTFVNGVAVCTPSVDTIPFWKSAAGVCKITVGYTDEIFQLCPQDGSGFKIRRQWRFVNWCENGRDTICIQYIKVEDKEAPILTGQKAPLSFNASAHDCYADVTLYPLGVDDCSKWDQFYTITGVGLDGKTFVKSGTLTSSTIVKLASPPNYDKCYTVNVRVTDKCLNTSTATYSVCVYDITPPTPVCDEFTVTTVDPATCWARVYAEDLDNGSRDNCCNILHFAVATMDSIDGASQAFVKYWNSKCFNDYWKYKPAYDAFLADYINTFVFKDYIDLTECGDHQVVLRVYEACGIPRYDPHIFPCSEHEWYLYNTSSMGRAWHNYTFFHNDGVKLCGANPGIKWCRSDWEAWFAKADAGSVNPLINNSGGVNPFNCSAYTYQIFNTFYPGGIDGCAFDNFYDCVFYWPAPPIQPNGYPQAPGNRCSSFLYNDCMVNVHVDDKTPPVCVGIRDLYYYCDGVYGIDENSFPTSDAEYAHLSCDEEKPFPNYTCQYLGSPYKEVELSTEDDVNQNAGTTTADWYDPIGVAYGYYGCATGVSGHPIDEHTPVISGCEI